MITYDLMLEKQRLLGADRFSVAANANETLSLRFNFDRNWRRFDSKAAVFRNSDMQYFIIEIIANRVKIPWEVLTKQGTFELSVIGFDGAKTLTSDKVEIAVSENLLPEEYKTLSPSEVLFDRFKEECIAEAYLKYETEFENLKKSHADEKMRLNAEIAEANERTLEAVEEKNNEIEQIKNEHSKEISGYRSQISELNEQITEYKEKAEKWDMVDHAIQGKTLASSPLWGGGSEEYRLPMLNTSSVKAFAARNFDTNLRELGLDLSSCSVFQEVFMGKNSIQKLTLKNTNNITSYESLACTCTSIRYLDIGNLESCTNITQLAMEASRLEKVKFTNMCRISTADCAFYGCPVLKEIDGVFDFRTVTNAEEIFIGTPMLETVRFLENSITKDISFQDSISLTKESLLSIANGLSSENTATVYLSSYAIDNAFTDEEEKSAYLSLIQTTKGWNLEMT